jgi:acetyl-CoA carboxylase biotin carboxyl carrier protein
MSADDPNQTHSQGGGQGAAAGSQHQAEGGAQERGGPQRPPQQAHGRHRRGGGGRQPQRGQGQQQQRRGESTLNLDELRELTELFSEHGLTDFEFENADIRIRLSRNIASAGTQPAAAPVPHTPAHIPPQPAPIAQPPAAAQQPAAGQSETAPAAEAAAPEDLHTITSPIVGTFYRAPSPTSDVFVKVGSRVEPASVVCIIEAMKLMNEIQAETSGVIEKIYVENGQPVEYGQPLFGVRK